MPKSNKEIILLGKAVYLAVVCNRMGVYNKSMGVVDIMDMLIELYRVDIRVNIN